MRYDLPTTPRGWKLIADCLAWYAVINSIAVPILAIFSGQLWGPIAFVGGAYVVTAIIFGCEYFGEDYAVL